MYLRTSPFLTTTLGSPLVLTDAYIAVFLLVFTDIAGPNLTTRAPFQILVEMKTALGLHPNEDQGRSSFGMPLPMAPKVHLVDSNRVI